MLNPFALFTFFGFLLGICFFTKWARAWGSSEEEQERRLPGDSHLDSSSAPSIRMTRSVGIQASPHVVWRWIAQMGRGAGWYSYDLIDNGAKPSARHLVTWIPEPEVGDTCAIGRLTTLIPEQSLVWWADSVNIPWGTFRCVFDLHLSPQGSHSRLIVRVSADATGPLAWPLLHSFSFFDSIMARKQLLKFKFCAETYGARTENPSTPETGFRDQYQLAACLYVSGGTAGKWGHALSRKWAEPRSDDVSSS